MKRIIERKDLMNKMEYSKQYNINRVAIDKMIEEGKLVVERISGVDYIRLKIEVSEEVK
jgi:very-short-patch-repair endonuclease